MVLAGSDCKKRDSGSRMMMALRLCGYAHAYTVRDSQGFSTHPDISRKSGLPQNLRRGNFYSALSAYLDEIQELAIEVT